MMFFNKIDIKKSEAKAKENAKELEKKDIPALIIAASIIMIPVLVAGAAIIGIAYYLFLGRHL